MRCRILLPFLTLLLSWQLLPAEHHNADEPLDI